MKETVLKEIAEEFGTPSYVFDLDVLSARVQRMQEILGENVRIIYAMKANPFLVQAMGELAAGYEVCSPGEFAICEREQVDMQRIVLSGVNKEKQDIEYVMDECGGVGMYTVESLNQFRLLNACASARKQRIRVLLRLTSGNQFGMNEETIEQLIQNRADYEYIDFRGIQCYTGTQKKKLDHIAKEVDMLDAFCDRLFKEYGYRAEELEYGPGLPISYFQPEAENNGYEMLQEFAAKLAPLREKYKVSLEMGRYIAATCGMFLTRIADMKVNHNQKYCIVDGGINHVNYYGQTMAMKLPKYDFIAMPDNTGYAEAASELTASVREAAAGMQNWNICGSLCTVGDVLIKNLPLENASLGDLLVLYNIGAYSVTEGIYLFLSRNLPNIITYREAEGAVLLRGQNPTYTINSRMPELYA